MSDNSNLYLDIVESAALLFSDGLPAGGLVDQILIDEPFEALRANCHSLVDDDTLRETRNFIRSNIVVERDLNVLRAVGSDVMLRIAETVKRRCQRHG